VSNNVGAIARRVSLMAGSRFFASAVLRLRMTDLAAALQAAREGLDGAAKIGYIMIRVMTSRPGGNQPGASPASRAASPSSRRHFVRIISIGVP
jgi:hypothetical protein